MRLAETVLSISDEELANGTVAQDSSTAKTLVATFGSIEKTEDVPSPLLTKSSGNIPAVHMDASSDADLSPDEPVAEMSLSLQRSVFSYIFPAVICAVICCKKLRQ